MSVESARGARYDELRARVVRLGDWVFLERKRLLGILDHLAAELFRDCILLTSVAAEDLFGWCLLRAGKDLREPDFGKRLDAAVHARIVPQDVAQQFHTLRVVGNKTRHGDGRVEYRFEDALHHFEALVLLLRWSHEKWDGGPRHPSIFGAEVSAEAEKVAPAEEGVATPAVLVAIHLRRTPPRGAGDRVQWERDQRADGTRLRDLAARLGGGLLSVGTGLFVARFPMGDELLARALSFATRVGATVAPTPATVALDVDDASLPDPSGPTFDAVVHSVHRAAPGEVRAPVHLLATLRRVAICRESDDHVGVIEVRAHTAANVVQGAAPWVGREAEVQAIARGWQEAWETLRPVVCHVAGPPGSGRTRLVREALQRVCAGDDAPRVDWLDCSPGWCLHPADPLGSALRQRFGADGADVDQARVRWADGLNSLADVDRVLVRSGRQALTQLVGLAERGELDGKQPLEVATRLAVAIFQGSARTAGWILVLDNAEWLREVGRSLLSRLVEGVGTAALVVLITGEVHAPPLGGDAVLVRVPPLERRDALRLATHWLGPGRAALKARIADLAEGNPMHIEELCWASREGQLAISPTMRGVIGRQVTRLPGDEVEVLRSIAALAGRALDAGEAETAPPPGRVWAGLLRTLHGAGTDDVLRRLQERRLIGPAPVPLIAGEREYLVLRPLVYQAVEEAVGDEVRVRVCRQGLAWISERMGTRGDGLVRQVIDWARVTGDHGRAVDALAELASRTLAGFALGEARTLLLGALALARQQGNDVVVACLTARLAEVSGLEGRSEEAVRLLRSLPEDEDERLIRSRTALLRASVHRQLGEGAQAMAAIDEATAGFERLGRTLDVHKALDVKATVLVYQGEVRAAEAVVAELLSRRRATGEDATRTRRLLAEIHLQRANFHAARQLLSDNVRLAADSAIFRYGRGEVALRAGWLDEAEADFEAALDLNARLGLFGGELVCAASLWECRRRRGDDVQAGVARCLSALTPDVSGDFLRQIAMFAGFEHLARGDAAAPLFERAAAAVAHQPLLAREPAAWAAFARRDVAALEAVLKACEASGHRLLGLIAAGGLEVLAPRPPADALPGESLRALENEGLRAEAALLRRAR